MSSYFNSTKEMMEYVLGGGKITKFKWNVGHFLVLDNEGNFVDQNGKLYLLKLETCCDFKKYIEPKKKKQITLYRSTYSGGSGYYFQGEWTTDNERKHSYKVVKTETKTIEVEDET